MTEKIKVSVIVPVFNVEPYLSNCLDSILAQKYVELEVICVDDASTDNSLKILSSYQSVDPRIIVIRQPSNLGQSSARNKGLEYANGKYILFVDADDIIKPNLIEVAVQYAEQNSLDFLNYSYDIITNETGWDWKTRTNRKSNIFISQVMNGRDFLVAREDLQRNYGAPWAACSSLYNRLFLKKNNLVFYAGIIHEDVLFYFKSCMLAERVMYISHNLYLYRKVPGSTTTSWRENRGKSVFIVISEIYADWLRGHYSDEVNQAIGSLLQSMWNVYNRAQMSGEKEYEKDSISPAADFMYRMVNGMLPSKLASIDDKDIHYLKQQSQFILFGCGNFSADIVCQLEREELRPSYVMVTNRMGNPPTFAGIRVNTVDELGYIADAPVVVACSERLCKGIKDMLHGIGYENLILAKYVKK